MPKPIDTKQLTRYVLKRERSLPVGEQSVFLLRPLTVRAEHEAQDELREVTRTDGSKVAGSPYAYALAVLRHGLASWENFAAPFKVDEGSGLVSRDCLDALSEADRGELFRAINEQGTSKLTEDERKN